MNMSTDHGDDRDETTVDQKKIRKWANQREGVPARTTDDSDRLDTLRIAFAADEESGTAPTLDDENITEISWARFFEAFDERNLAFRYRDDDESRYYEIIDRDDADVTETPATDELLEDSVVVQAATGTEAVEPGMDVVDVSDEKVGVVSQVSGPRIYIDPDPGLTDKLKIEFGWGDTTEDDDVYRVPENQIETVEGEAVRIYRPE